jgi:DNA polymerase III subunit delta
MPLINAFDSITTAAPIKSSVIVLFGNDNTLHSWILEQLCGKESEDDRVDLSGDTAEWRDLRDELNTSSLFAQDSNRWVVLHDGDKFVEKNRDLLESYFAKPNDSNRLVLRVNTFAANTRLYKAATASHTAVHCGIPQIKSGKSSRPDTISLVNFLVGPVAARCQCKLQKTAAECLIDLVGTDIGFLFNSLAKASLYLPVGGTVNEAHVREYVGGWKSKTTWEVIEAAATGKAGEALQHLGKMLDGGERPLALMPQFAWSLRRLAMAEAALDYGDRTGRKIPLTAALQQAGFRAWDSQKGEQQIRQIGRARTSALMRWLLEADLKLKLTHSTDERGRWVLEELFLKLASAS